MGIARVRKIQIIAHQSTKEKLIDQLQKEEIAQIIDLKEKLIQPDYDRIFIEEEAVGDEELERALAKIEYSINYLARFEEKRAGLLDSLVKPKFTLRRDEFTEIIHHFDYKESYRELNSIDHRLKEISDIENRLRAQHRQIFPWTNLTIPLEEIRQARYTFLCLGTVAARDFSELCEEIETEKIPTHLQTINEDKTHRYLLVIYLRADEDRMSSILKKFNFNYITFPNLKGIPSRIIKDIETRIDEIEKQRKQLEDRAKGLLPIKAKLMALYDYLSNKKARQDIRRCFLRTDQTFIIEGWIRGADAEGLKRRLSRSFPETEVMISDPGPEENPPVILENNRTIQPFETITNLYGLPGYAKIDPTPLLAPFFFIFFGLCLSDAGYGIVLMAIGYLGLKKMRLGEGGRRFMRLLVFVGGSTVILGAMMGGWFGNSIDLLSPAFEFLRKAKDKLLIFDPLKDSLKFITLVLALGFAQVLFGVIIKMYGRIKADDAKGAILDCGSLAVLLLGIPLFGAARMGLIGEYWGGLGAWMVVLGAGTVVLFAGRSNRNIAKRLLIGLYGLYGTIGYMGDILSYFRLFALGLATAVVAMAVNTISQLALSTPYVGPLLAIILLIIGHSFNIAINALGAFVHSARLQFLEFFTKFFEGGGKPFRPFKTEAKYIAIEAL